LSHVAGGLVDANQGIVNVIIGELSNISNQNTAFALIPVFQACGAILGMLAGGILTTHYESHPLLFGGIAPPESFPYNPIICY
jgi:MFS family permease